MVRNAVAVFIPLFLFLHSSPGAVAQTKPPSIWDPAHSSNYTWNSYDREIQYVILHTVEGSATAARTWFKNPAADVSAHYVIAYDGTIWQMVSDQYIAWHAGSWHYNKHSLAIEFEGYAGQNYWTMAQLQSAAALVNWIASEYGISLTRSTILGHDEVPGSSHWDPGSYFNWDYFMSLLDGSSESTDLGDGALQVAASALNVRSGPSTGTSIKGIVTSGQRYITIGESGAWKQIYFKGNVAWVHGGFVVAAPPGIGVEVSASVLNVRTGPSTGYGISGQTHAGEKYVRISASGSWYRIHWGGKERWVHGGYTDSFGYD